MTDMRNSSQSMYNLSYLEPKFKLHLLSGINVSSVTVRNYLSDFRFFAGWCQSHCQPLDNADDVEYPLNFIDSSMLQSFKQYLMDSGFPTRSVNRRLSTVRQFCSFACNAGLMKSNPSLELSNAHARLKRKNASLSPFKAFLSESGRSHEDIARITDDIQELFALTHMSYE